MSAKEWEERCAYRLWKGEVNLAMEVNYGFHPDDLPDCPYADWHGSGWEPEEAAQEAMTLAFGGDFMTPEDNAESECRETTSATEGGFPT